MYFSKGSLVYQETAVRPPPECLGPSEARLADPVNDVEVGNWFGILLAHSSYATSGQQAHDYLAKRGIRHREWPD